MDICAAVQAISVIAISILVGIENQITVLISPSVIRICGILVAQIIRKECRSRHHLAEGRKLLEKRPRKIKWSAELGIVNRVGIPMRLTKDGNAALGWVMCDNRLRSCVADASKEMELIHLHHATPFAATRTKCRIGHFEFLIECTILVG